MNKVRFGFPGCVANQQLTFMKVDDKCYHQQQTQLWTFKEGLKYCHRLGGDLVTIKNREEHEFVKTMASGFESTWLAASKLNKSKEYVWPDQSELFFANWTLENLISCNQQLCCAVFIKSDGEWQTSTCSYHRGVLCEVPCNRSHRLEPLVQYLLTTLVVILIRKLV